MKKNASNKSIGIYSAIITSICFSSGAIFAKNLTNFFTPITLITSSIFFGFLCISLNNLLFGFPFFRNFDLKKNFLHYFAIGPLGTGISLLLIIDGIAKIPSSIAGFILQTESIAAICCSYFIFKESISKLQMYGIILSFLGILILTGFFSNDLKVISIYGIFEVALGSFLFGISSCSLKILSQRLHPFQLTWIRLLSACPLLIFVFFLEENTFFRTFNLLNFTWLAYSISNFYFAYLFLNIALTKTSLWVVTLCLHTIPIFTLLFSNVFLNEKLRGVDFIGCIFIIIGVLIVSEHKLISKLSLKRLR